MTKNYKTAIHWISSVIEQTKKGDDELKFRRPVLLQRMQNVQSVMQALSCGKEHYHVMRIMESATALRAAFTEKQRVHSELKNKRFTKRHTKIVNQAEKVFWDNLHQLMEIVEDKAVLLGQTVPKRKVLKSIDVPQK